MQKWIIKKGGKEEMAEQERTFDAHAYVWEIKQPTGTKKKKKTREKI